MDIKEAIAHLITSDAFKDKAKQKNAEGGRYRMFLTRYNKGEIKNGVAVDFLMENGYRVEVKKPK